MTNILIDGDFKNIEGRVNAWLAGEDWKLQAFRDFDAGTGPDLYKVAYSRAFGVPHEDVTKAQRQRGKVMELAGGYQGGVGSYLSMGPTYGLRPQELVEPVSQAIDPAVWVKTLGAYDKAIDKHHLPREQWAAIKTLVWGWRKSNPRIVASWRNLQRSAIAAIDNPGRPVTVENYRGVTFLCRGGFLWCRLPGGQDVKRSRFTHARIPGGRHLSYFNPRIEIKRQRSVAIDGAVYGLDDFAPDVLFDMIFSRRAEIVEGKEQKNAVIEGKVQGSGKGGGWGRKHLYGGLLCENIVQATAYDIQTAKMLEIEGAGFPIVMHTHDNITAEIASKSIDELTAKFRSIMASPLPWAPDLPIEAEVHAGKRYAGN